ncbi:hypothetical protein DPMN_127941 [Dreissena polymorpha]|uniref:Profilin n=1 Tax=Dreissena polymorpha TaxID=45954 RepID=A0A9D4H676_DREPO|nr:hypothetical protein DPMN_127941 [Dreissena polymorpha]
MSWEAYVKGQLMTPGDMASAGIYGLDGGEWSREGPIKPLPTEITRLIAIIQGKETDFNSIRLGGMSFLYITHDPQEGCITLNRINAPSDEEKYVCCGYLSKGCFIFGAVVGNWRMGNCSKVSCRLRDYLKQVGY